MAIDRTLINNINYELIDLKEYIISKCAVNCHIGMRDNDPNSYPIVEITWVEEGSLFAQNYKLNTLIMPLSLTIITSRGNEVQAFEFFNKLVIYLNQFHVQKGHEIAEKIRAEYTENTYEITILYNFQLVMQNTN